MGRLVLLDGRVALRLRRGALVALRGRAVLQQLPPRQVQALDALPGADLSVDVALLLAKEKVETCFLGPQGPRGWLRGPADARGDQRLVLAQASAERCAALAAAMGAGAPAEVPGDPWASALLAAAVGRALHGVGLEAWWPLGEVTLERALVGELQRVWVAWLRREATPLSQVDDRLGREVLVRAVDAFLRGAWPHPRLPQRGEVADLLAAQAQQALAFLRGEIPVYTQLSLEEACVSS